MPTIIKINPIQVLVFPTMKYAHHLLIENVEVKLKDDGVKVIYHLLDENNALVYQGGYIELTNDEINNWTTTDEQLIDSILMKLNIQRADNESNTANLVT